MRSWFDIALHILVIWIQAFMKNVGGAGLPQIVFRLFKVSVLFLIAESLLLVCQLLLCDVLIVVHAMVCVLSYALFSTYMTFLS